MDILADYILALYRSLPVNSEAEELWVAAFILQIDYTFRHRLSLPSDPYYSSSRSTPSS